MSARYANPEEKQRRGMQRLQKRIQEKHEGHVAQVTRLLAVVQDAKKDPNLINICASMAQQLGNFPAWTETALELFTLKGGGKHNERARVINALLANGLSPVTLAEFLIEFGSCEHSDKAASDFAGLLYKYKIGAISLAGGASPQVKIFNHAANTLDGEPALYPNTVTLDLPRIEQPSEKLLHSHNNPNLLERCGLYDIAICKLMKTGSTDRDFYKNNLTKIELGMKQHMVRKIADHEQALFTAQYYEDMAELESGMCTAERYEMLKKRYEPDNLEKHAQWYIDTVRKAAATRAATPQFKSPLSQFVETAPTHPSGMRPPLVTDKIYKGQKRAAAYNADGLTQLKPSKRRV